MDSGRLVRSTPEEKAGGDREFASFFCFRYRFPDVVTKEKRGASERIKTLFSVLMLKLKAWYRQTPKGTKRDRAHAEDHGTKRE